MYQHSNHWYSNHADRIQFAQTFLQWQDFKWLFSTLLKYRFAAAPALVIYEAAMFSPCFTGLKLWSWSSWRRFVSWEEATKSFSRRLTTLRRYERRREGKRGHYTLTVQFSERWFSLQECSPCRCETSRFLTAAFGCILEFVFFWLQDYRRWFSCMTQGDTRDLQSEQLSVLAGFGRQVKDQNSRAADVTDSPAWSSLVWMRYSGCCENDWEDKYGGPVWSIRPSNRDPLQSMQY